LLKQHKIKIINTKKPYRLIISGGGTGGHIFPAIAVARKIMELHPDTVILFVGAKGKMEMTKVPEAGFEIIGLWISGMQRKVTVQNLLLPLKIVASLIYANKILRKVKPHAVIGFGGYASAPILYQATKKKIPCIIQEQNSRAGIANKFLGKRVSKICVAFDGMDKYFPKEKIQLTGNPVRGDMLDIYLKRSPALEHFNLMPQMKTLLVLGGSLGARTINESVVQNIGEIINANIQLVWQTGKLYHEEMVDRLSHVDQTNIRIKKFIEKMDLAYAAADVVVSRAGALTLAELALAGKPVIFVPSPNVAEDHQTKNARYLVDKEAALLINDKEAIDNLVKEALKLLDDQDRQTKLKKNIVRESRPKATEDIVRQITQCIN